MDHLQRRPQQLRHPVYPELLQPWLQKKGRPATERDLIRAAKLFEGCSPVLTAMFIAPFLSLPARILHLCTDGQRVLQRPHPHHIFIGFLTRRVPPIAARIGLWFFIICYGASQLLFTVPLHFLHVLAHFLFVLTSILMLPSEKLYPMPVPYRQKLNNLVDIQPWKNRHIAAGILLLLMVGIFFIFSRAGLAK